MGTFFYDLNKKLNGIRELPETTHKQLNESKPDFLDLDRDGDKKEPMKQAAKQKPDYKSKMQDKFGGSASDLTKGLTTKSKKVDEGNHSKDAMELNPDFAKVGKKPGVMGKIAQGVKKVADFVAPGDEDLMRDFERETNGRRPTKEAAPMSAKQKSFAALAEPKDKITFADKIAGAKKEVDEMLGDVAAEAMKAALGKGKQATMGEATKEIPGGRRHTAGPGGYGRKDDEDAPRVQTQRGRGRPKKNADSETGQVMKPDWSAFGVGKVNLPKHKGAVTKHKMVGEESDPQTWTTIEDVEFIQDLMDRAFEAGSNALGNTLQGVLEKIKYNQDDEEQMNEKAVAGDLKYELDEQGVAEGKINTARMNKPHQDFYSKNPHFKRDDKEVVAQGGKLATKVSPSGTKQVSKKPATPFGKTVSEDASGGASAAGSVAGVNNPGGKPKSQVGSLFGGTYQRKKKTTSK